MIGLKYLKIILQKLGKILLDHPTDFAKNPHPALIKKVSDVPEIVV